MKINDYVIISASSLDKLQQSVQEFLGSREVADWSALGAPFFQPDPGGSWHQAMVEVSEPDK
jgi:hypothetical protein